MNLFHESKLTLKLAFPMMIGQLSQMMLGVVDTVMVGRLGVTELAALTFANALFHIPFVFGMGLLTGITVLTSNARGAENAAGVRASCRHGLYIATAIGLLLFAASWIVSMNLEHFGQPPDVVERTVGFFRLIMLSVIPGLAAIALKNHADALNRPWTPFWIFLAGVALNIGLNWLLIYGNLGAPKMGLEGAAVATLTARIVMVIAMIVWLLNAKDLREWVPFRWFRKPDFADLKRLLAIGFPASLHMLWEVSAFSAAGLIMGHFGKTAMAAHQIAITCAATAFMIPLGLSMALTVRMGQVNGAAEIHRLRSIAISGWLLATGYSVLGAIFFGVFGKTISAMFIDAPDVIQLTASLLVIVGFFQIVDSLQVASSGMLRGLHDAKIPARMGFISYWIVGLPIGAWLALHLKMGAIGVWWGLASGLAVAAITLGPRLWKRTKMLA
jgi:MATE family multidrug resistance protein